MKRIYFVLFAALLGLSFVSCSSSAEPSREGGWPAADAPSGTGNSLNPGQANGSESPQSGNSGSGSPESGNSESGNSGSGNPVSAQDAGDILIVYFSRWGNTDYPEDISHPFNLDRNNKHQQYLHIRKQHGKCQKHG